MIVVHGQWHSCIENDFDAFNNASEWHGSFSQNLDSGETFTKTFKNIYIRTYNLEFTI